MIKSILFTLIGSAIINFSVAQAPKPIAKTAEGFYNDGIKLKDQKKYPAAILSFKNAIAKNPNYKEAFYAAGWCSNELNKYSDALGYLQKAKTLWPDEAKVYLELGYANQQSGKDNEAKDCYNKCLSLKDDYSLAYQYLGNLFFSEKDYKKALQEYDSYSKYEPNITSATVYYKMGYCQDDAEKYNDAVSSLNKAISLKAGYVDAYNELGYANKKLEKADDAIKNYNDALRFDPKSTTAINGIGDVYKDVKKDMDEALKTFFRSLAIDPKNKKTNYLIGWCYNDKGKYNDAVPYLKKALEADKDYTNAITELGYCDYALENYDDALRLFNRAIFINKTDLTVYYAGLSYIGLKQKANAQKIYDELVDMQSDYAVKLKAKIDKM